MSSFFTGRCSARVHSSGPLLEETFRADRANRDEAQAARVDAARLHQRIDTIDEQRVRSASPLYGLSVPLYITRIASMPRLERAQVELFGNIAGLRTGKT
jgi:hypothetical protein